MKTISTTNGKLRELRRLRRRLKQLERKLRGRDHARRCKALRQLLVQALYGLLAELALRALIDWLVDDQPEWAA